MRKNYKHDASKKNECRGRGADSKWVVQKIKGKKEKRRAGWAWFWTGLGLKRVGLGEEYIRVETHFFLIFSFLSLSSPS